jgi:hypothetical protein
MPHHPRALNQHSSAALHPLAGGAGTGRLTASGPGGAVDAVGVVGPAGTAAGADAANGAEPLAPGAGAGGAGAASAAATAGSGAETLALLACAAGIGSRYASGPAPGTASFAKAWSIQARCCSSHACS